MGLIEDFAREAQAVADPNRAASDGVETALRTNIFTAPLTGASDAADLLGGGEASDIPGVTGDVIGGSQDVYGGAQDFADDPSGTIRDATGLPGKWLLYGLVALIVLYLVRPLLQIGAHVSD